MNETIFFPLAIIDVLVFSPLASEAASARATITLASAGKGDVLGT